MPINWDKPLQWSNGEEITLAPYDEASDGYRSVTANSQWRTITDDRYVAVDPKTGRILGCEYDGYPHVRNVPEHPPVYLHLFHGRGSPDENLDGWGTNGPTIGPLDYVHVTYLCDIKYGFQDDNDAEKFGIPPEGHFKLVDDLLEYDGRFYGDFSVNAFPCTGYYELRVGEVGHGTTSGTLQLTLHDALALFEKERGTSPELKIELIDIGGDAEVVIAEHTP